jgi:hypothetical protein
MGYARSKANEKFLAANGRQTQTVVERAAALMVSFSSGSIFGQAEVDVGCDNKPLPASLWLLKSLGQLFTECRTSIIRTKQSLRAIWFVRL